MCRRLTVLQLGLSDLRGAIVRTAERIQCSRCYRTRRQHESGNWQKYE
jgi:hypothetical protein